MWPRGEGRGGEKGIQSGPESQTLPHFQRPGVTSEGTLPPEDTWPNPFHS